MIKLRCGACRVVVTPDTAKMFINQRGTKVIRCPKCAIRDFADTKPLDEGNH